MNTEKLYWVAGLIVVASVLLFKLRGATRVWRRKRRYRLRMQKAASFWKNLEVSPAPKDSLYIIATLTTAPDRIHLIEPILQSLTVGQSRPPNEIHLNIPHRFARTGAEYIIPDFIKDYPVKVFRCEDEGPGTKLIPAIRRTAIDNDVWFFIVDDDVRHLPKALETLVRFAQSDPSAAYGYADNYLYRKWSPPNGDVDILCGFAGFIVHRLCFGDNFEDYLTKVLTNKSCRFHDDVYLSNYLALHNVPRIRIATDDVSLDRMEELGCLLEQGAEVGSLAMGAGSGENTRLRSHRAMDHLISINLGGLRNK